MRCYLPILAAALAAAAMPSRALRELTDSEAATAASRQVAISGRVVDDATGKPVTRFALQGGQVDRGDAAKITWGFWLQSGGERPAGTFDVSLNWAEGGRARIISAGYVSQSVLEKLPDAAARKVDGVVVRLKRGRVVAGRVLDSAGRPVADAGIYVVGNPSINLTGGRSVDLSGEPVEDHRAARVATGADGAFTVTGVGGDAVRIAVTCAALDLWVVPVPGTADEAHPLEIRLPPPGRLVVRYDIEGAPAKARLMLQHHTWDKPGWEGTDNVRYADLVPGGETVLANLPPGTYTVDRTKNPGLEFEHEKVMLDRRTFTVETGQTVAVDFVRPAGARISGQVLGLDEGEVAKAGPTRVYIRVVRDEDRDRFPSALDVIGLEPGAKPLDGRFTTERIPPGRYRVRAEVFVPETAEQRRHTGLIPPAFEGETPVTVLERGAPDPVQIRLAPFRYPERGR